MRTCLSIWGVHLGTLLSILKWKKKGTREGEMESIVGRGEEKKRKIRERKMKGEKGTRNDEDTEGNGKKGKRGKGREGKGRTRVT